ncbi:MAG TPA: hypothetical protein IAD36_07115 [Candidatus Scatomorpha intestinigallinarum]|uniref:Na+/glutamate symporter n=1 Tax=Candidatus Scatomorpha intestinigallinarum TaxID=2840923 RepID=A0A9D1IZF4_9FIRM|nr:hypothetical protein [Candidatus Scatomorpha intestinigallinarum]
MQGPMLSILAVFIILLIFGLGDMVATKTRAIVSMLFFSSVLFLAGFWTKVLPNTMFDDSTLLLVSGVLVSMLLVHMGTTIKLRDFADQWKTVIIAGIACIAISLGIYFIGGLIVADKNYVVVGAPILSGGVVATITMQTAVEGHSVELGVFAALVMVVQGFVGYPVCSLCLKSEAKRVRSLVESGQELKGVTAKIVTDAAPKKRLIPYIPDKYNGPNIMMAKVAFFAFLATITANAINGWIASTFETAFSISALIFALIYGIIAKELGFIEENPMKRAGADGFMLVVVTLSIFTNLAQSTPDMVAGMLWPLLVVVVTGSVTFLIISTLVGKIFGVSWQMSCAIGSTCLFGFPGTYIVTNEVVNATAANDEEKQLMLDHMMPKMLIAGMVSVSITSVLIAGYMVNLLVF